MAWALALFSFKGRLPRARFWLYLAISLPLCAVLLVSFWAYALSIPGAYENGGPTPFPTSPPWIAAAIVFFALLALILMTGIVVSIRRLQDRGKAWWWLLLFLILPNLLFGLGSYLAEIRASSDISSVLWLASFGVVLWGFVELALLPGTAAENRYGRDPRTPIK